MLLRFGLPKHVAIKKPILNFKAISKIVNIPYRTVIDLIKVGILAHSENRVIAKRTRSKLSAEHITYLTNTNTLNGWAHSSLKERVKRFHRHFGEVKISVSTLRHLYRRHKIKFKFIKRLKKEIDFTDKKYNELFIRMRTLIELSKIDK